MENRTIKIGTIIKGFGIKGEVKVRIDTDSPEKRFKIGSSLSINHNDTIIEVIIDGFRMHQNHALLHFEGYPDLTSVEGILPSELFISSSDLEEGVYSYQLIGCKVIDQDNILMGTVIEYLQYPAQDIIRIKTSDKDKLIPFVDRFIKRIDIEKKEIHIERIEGL